MLTLIRARQPLWQLSLRGFGSSAIRRGGSEGEQLIRQKLETRFTPSKLEVMDVSGGCGEFYAINIASKAFQGLSMVKQHKLVNEELKAEIKTIHGLQLKTSSE